MTPHKHLVPESNVLPDEGLALGDHEGHGAGLSADPGIVGCVDMGGQTAALHSVGTRCSAGASAQILLLLLFFLVLAFVSRGGTQRAQIASCFLPHGKRTPQTIERVQRPRPWTRREAGRLAALPDAAVPVCQAAAAAPWLVPHFSFPSPPSLCCFSPSVPSLPVSHLYYCEP